MKILYQKEAFTVPLILCPVILIFLSYRPSADLKANSCLSHSRHRSIQRALWSLRDPTIRTDRGAVAAFWEKMQFKRHLCSFAALLQEAWNFPREPFHPPRYARGTSAVCRLLPGFPRLKAASSPGSPPVILSMLSPVRILSACNNRIAEDNRIRSVFRAGRRGRLNSRCIPQNAG